MATDDAGYERLLALLGDTVGDVSVDRLLDGGVAQLDMSGAGVSVVTGAGDRGIVHATDRVSTTIEELQVSLGEGPCVDTWLRRLPVFEPDLAQLAGGRWPGFAPAARAAGAAAVFSVPLQVGRTHLGALDVYRDTPGGLSAHDVHDVLRLGDAVTQVLLRSQQAAAGPEPPPSPTTRAPRGTRPTSAWRSTRPAGW